MKYFVRPEANILILRHFQAESNLLNFVIDNSGKDGVAPVEIYPKEIQDLMVQTFVHHDQGILMTMRDLGQMDTSNWPIKEKICHGKTGSRCALTMVQKRKSGRNFLILKLLTNCSRPPFVSG